MRTCYNILLAALPFVAIALAATSDASAQFVSPLKDERPPSAERLIFPDLKNGDHVWAGELHIHTVFSDGATWPSYRLLEAKRDGLKFVSFTEHDIVTPKKRDVSKNKNRSYEIARDFIDTNFLNLGDMNIALGTEVTRNIGHFNCHFLKDANKLNEKQIHISTFADVSTALKPDWQRASIVEKELEPVLEEARRQGGICQWNHPAAPSPTAGEVVVTPFLERMFKTGLISGIEVANGETIYPKAIDVALKYNLYMAGVTDAHIGVDMERAAGEREHRTTTLFLTKGNEASNFSDALHARRTIGLYRSTLIGRPEDVQNIVESMLDLTLASYVKPNEIGLLGGYATFVLKNNGPIKVDIEVSDPGWLSNRGRYFSVPAGGVVALKTDKFVAKGFSGIKMRVMNSYVNSSDPLEFSLKPKPFDLEKISSDKTIIPRELDGFL
jgi:hypothetical protein